MAGSFDAILHAIFESLNLILLLFFFAWAGVSTTGRRWALLPGIPAGKHDGPSQFITSKDVIPYTPLPSEQSSDRGSPSDSIVAELSRAAAEAGAPAVGSTQRAIGLVQQEAATSALITEPKKQAASRQFIKVGFSPPPLQKPAQCTLFVLQSCL